MLSLVGHPCAINPDSRLQAHAEELDWQIRDYRTGRKAARVGLLGAGAAGAAAGAVATGHRRSPLLQTVTHRDRRAIR